MINSKELVEFCAFHKITANQFLLCHLIYTGDHDLLSDYVTTEFKANNGITKNLAFKNSEIQDLIDKGFLRHIGTEKTQFDYQVTERFSEAYYVDSDEATEQLWDAYPKVIEVDGMMQSTRTCDKDKVLERYYKAIKGSRKKHDFVMRMLNHYKDLIRSKEMSGMGIEKWVTGENWETVAEAIGRTYDKEKFI